MIPAHVTQEVEHLRQKGYAVEVVEAEGWFNLVFEAYQLPPGYNKPATKLLLRLPLAYPNGRPDMFWTDEDLTFKDGKVPKNAESIEVVLGKGWRRFSWHPQNWNPAADDLRTYLEFVNRRLSQLT